jgi:hypothetical protein
MRQEAGWTAAIAVAIAAALGVTSQHGEKSLGDQSAPAQAASQKDRTGPAGGVDLSLGPCAQIEDHLKSFLGMEDSQRTVVPQDCYGAPKQIVAGAANPPNKVQHAAANVPSNGWIHLRFLIATLPDPTHTHFPLEFDRMSEAIQQGASDEGYVYDSSWLPWVTKDSTFGSLQDQDAADKRKEAQEEQPGLLLFRKKPDESASHSGSASASLPYRDGLVVFIVGEEPTHGIHRDQFENATAWIAALETHEPNKRRLPPIVLGPSFSGSAYSLAELVSDPEIDRSPMPGSNSEDERLRIYSGNLTGNKAMAWTTAALGSNVDFASFQHSDGFLMSRYCEYLNESKFDLSRLAILSEDQTAYGSEVPRTRPGAPRTAAQKKDPIEKEDSSLPACSLSSAPADATGINSAPLLHQPLRVFYPRDISALRAAYQSESIFNAPTASSSEGSQRSLAPDIADPQGNQHDSIRAYSGDQRALSQEAVLQQIVSELRIHQSEYILLRSSNVLDQIFLSHYLRLGYPQGRIVILGSDQLLRRESGAARLSGIMTLTTYPLLPWEPHWTQRLDDPTAHSHRVFAQDRSEGVYVATRALLHFPVTLEPGQECEPLLERLVEAHYTIKSAAGGPDADPGCLCASKDNSTPVSIQARNAEAMSELALTFKRNSDDQYVLDSIESGVAPKKNRSSATQPPSASFVQRYSLRIPQLTGFVPVTDQLRIPDYRAPFWIDGSAAYQDDAEAPAAWLSVLGRNDFWPLAALTPDSIYEDSLAGQTPADQSVAHGAQDAPWGKFAHDFGRAFRSLFNVFRPREYGSQNAVASRKNRASGDRTNAGCANGSAIRWFPMPMSVRLVLAAFLIGCGFHFLCCVYPSVMQKPSHRAYFVCVGEYRLPFLTLMVLGSVTISATATVLASGFGALSPDGAPLASPGLWLLVQPFFWSIAGLALAINVWKQPSAWFCLSRQRLFGTARSCRHRRLALWGAVGASLVGTLVFYFAYYLSTERILTVANRVPAYWRSMDFTDGVSPIVPPLVIGVGVYLWVWYSLQGLALLGRDRPRLPRRSLLTLEIDDPSGGKKKTVNWLRMFSDKDASERIEALSGPFAPRVLKRAIVLFALQLLAAAYLGFRSPFSIEVPLRSLGARSYSILICLLMDILFSTTMANAWQLLNVWYELRKLLTHLDRLPLRRSMAAFPGVSWKSVWTISGNVLDMRYKLLTNELRCVMQLKNCLPAPNPLSAAIAEIEKSQGEFAQWYSKFYDKPDSLDQKPVEKIQRRLANLAGLLMTKVLLPAWGQEEGAILASDIAADGSSNQENQREELKPVSRLDPLIRHAEQLVCYVYLGFIQNVLGRMRSLVMCILLLFIAATIAMASYPFDPRPSISGAMVLLFGVLTAAVVVVYAQVHRDPILSLVTNTKPGELGGDFWLKLLGFGAGPVLGLLTTLFPQLTDFLFSWVQPSLTSIK